MSISPMRRANRRQESVLGGLRRRLTGLFAVIGLATVLIVFTPLVSWWSRAYAGPIDHPSGDILILLSAATDDNGGISFSSYWRARFALVAWQTGSFKKIVISGGGGPGILNFLASNGVPREAMMAEWRSTSTRENGIETMRLLNGVPGRKVLLTSDFHIFRATRVFRKLGMEVTPMPIPDVMQSSEHLTGRFSGFETMTEESIKIAYYELRGWI